MVETYNDQVEAFSKAFALDRNLKVEDFVLKDEAKIKWSSSLLPQVSKGHKAAYSDSFIVESMYRPFCKQHLYNDSLFIHRPYQIPRLFPTPQSKNLVICISGVGVTKEFSCIMVDTIPDLELIGKSQCFPLYWYEKNERDALSLFDSCDDDYTRHSGVTDFILQRAREEFGPKVSAEDVFYYVYGLLIVRSIVNVSRLTSKKRSHGFLSLHRHRTSRRLRRPVVNLPTFTSTMRLAHSASS